MDYKKKYEEALERMKCWAKGEHPECFSEVQKAAEFVFPELKESEDEKIRKEIIEFFKARKYNCSERFITWLEKQEITNILPSDTSSKNNVEWDEEDEKIIRKFELIINNSPADIPTREKLVNWLKSLKYRCISLSEPWKPTQIQLECLRFCLECCNTDPALSQCNHFKIAFGVVESLYNQLKKM